MSLFDFKNKEKESDDRIFVKNVLISFIAIIICLATLCSVTWAWFTESVQSNQNTIKSADASLITAELYKDGTKVGVANTSTPLVVDCEGEYELRINLPQSSASGYIILTSNGTDYYTPSLIYSNEKEQNATITLKCNTNQSVNISVRWGIHSAASSVAFNGVLTLE